MGAHEPVGEELLALAEQLERCRAEVRAPGADAFPRARSPTWLGVGADAFNRAMARRGADVAGVVRDLDAAAGALRAMAADVRRAAECGPDPAGGR